MVFKVFNFFSRVSRFSRSFKFCQGFLGFSRVFKGFQGFSRVFKVSRLKKNA
jgi:hypothetical protein